MYVYVCKTQHLKIFEVPFPFESHGFPYRFSRFRASIRIQSESPPTDSEQVQTPLNVPVNPFCLFKKNIYTYIYIFQQALHISPLFFLFKSPYPLPRRHQEGEDHVGRVGHALGDPAGDDGRGGRTEGPLEEPVQGTRGGLQLTLGPWWTLGFWRVGLDA